MGGLPGRGVSSRDCLRSVKGGSGPCGTVALMCCQEASYICPTSWEDQDQDLLGTLL